MASLISSSTGSQWCSALSTHPNTCFILLRQKRLAIKARLVEILAERPKNWPTSNVSIRNYAIGGWQIEEDGWAWDILEVSGFSQGRFLDECGWWWSNRVLFSWIVGPTDMVALKMRGLPWRVEVEEIEQFFSRYAYVRDSIHLGVLSDGRKTGQAALLFENQ